jgi:hypothetical protein
VTSPDILWHRGKAHVRGLCWAYHWLGGGDRGQHPWCHCGARSPSPWCQAARFGPPRVAGWLKVRLVKGPSGGLGRDHQGLLLWLVAGRWRGAKVRQPVLAEAKCQADNLGVAQTKDIPDDDVELDPKLAAALAENGKVGTSGCRPRPPPTSRSHFTTLFLTRSVTSARLTRKTSRRSPHRRSSC